MAYSAFFLFLLSIVLSFFSLHASYSFSTSIFCVCFPPSYLCLFVSLSLCLSLGVSDFYPNVTSAQCSPHVRESTKVLDSGSQPPDSGSQHLDSGFQPFGFRINILCLFPSLISASLCLSLSRRSLSLGVSDFYPNVTSAQCTLLHWPLVKTHHYIPIMCQSMALPIFDLQSASVSVSVCLFCLFLPRQYFIRNSY